MDTGYESPERYIAILYSSKPMPKVKNHLTHQYYSIWENGLVELVAKINSVIEEFEEIADDYIIVDTENGHKVIYDSKTKLSIFSSKPARTVKEFIEGLPDGKELRTWNYLLANSLDITPRD